MIGFLIGGLIGAVVLIAMAVRAAREALARRRHAAEVDEQQATAFWDGLADLVHPDRDRHYRAAVAARHRHNQR